MASPNNSNAQQAHAYPGRRPKNDQNETDSSTFVTDHLGNSTGKGGENRKDDANAAPSAPYTQEEKDWLERNWGGEFNFLRCYSLSIHKDEDRDEGRRIARAMMEQDEQDEDEDEDPERSLQAHFADYNFTPEELDFIEAGWGNTEAFMITHGLKFYKDEDCEEAKAVVRALMADSDDESDV
ncbi:hypothetical protein C8A00DRAFT_29886 [Chaetomidium leptoderma]|uniref:Uncharacterized protein n=1 Tax=Chaetomidium leptoderma TaxID=669021 RepID=A0AAN6ZYX8_9PEZI|nr:hypothetical protein C8A00DRAFT_29886 [Chaetomidium leptoderma]